MADWLVRTTGCPVRVARAPRRMLLLVETVIVLARTKPHDAGEWVHVFAMSSGEYLDRPRLLEQAMRRIDYNQTQ